MTRLKLVHQKTDGKQIAPFAMNAPNTEIVRCPSCKAGNRIPAERMGTASARCGRCQAALFPERTSDQASDAYKLRCAQCGARNRVPGARIDGSPKCGKCGAPLPTAELFMPQPLMVTDGNFEAKVLKSPLPVLLFAWAPWCPTCSAAIPIVDQFASESKGRIRVGKVNVDTSPQVAGRYNIMSVPFLFIFDNGELRESVPGSLQKHELMLKMAHYL
jgi:thioredoxin 2